MIPNILEREIAMVMPSITPCPRLLSDDIGQILNLHFWICAILREGYDRRKASRCREIQSPPAIAVGLLHDAESLADERASLVPALAFVIGKIRPEFRGLTPS